MSTQRPFLRSLILALGCATLAACIVQTQSRPTQTRTRTTGEAPNGANPGYGDDEDDGGDGNPCGGTAVETGAMGHACGDGDACADGLECVRYYGIAGANGPEFSSCERRCDAGCPDGTDCVTIADGPGQVCRPTETAAPPAQATAAQGEKCGEGISCADGFTCIEYYGFAGPSGPKFASCEMRCGDGGTCPPGQACTTISDGPGTVCRPTGE